MTITRRRFPDGGGRQHFSNTERHEVADAFTCRRTQQRLELSDRRLFLQSAPQILFRQG
jgi:hypothetical protein